MMKYPWKRDLSSLPDNYAQVLNKFESTERFIKQPKHALSYDMKVKEMEEIKLSSKLTVKEKSEWKGPVHYPAQHAVLTVFRKEVYTNQNCV